MDEVFSPLSSGLHRLHLDDQLEVTVVTGLCLESCIHPCWLKVWRPVEAVFLMVIVSVCIQAHPVSPESYIDLNATAYLTFIITKDCV